MRSRKRKPSKLQFDSRKIRRKKQPCLRRIFFRDSVQSGNSSHFPRGLAVKLANHVRKPQNDRCNRQQRQNVPHEDHRQQTDQLGQQIQDPLLQPVCRSLPADIPPDSSFPPPDGLIILRLFPRHHRTTGGRSVPEAAARPRHIPAEYAPFSQRLPFRKAVFPACSSSGSAFQPVQGNHC